MKYFSSHLFYRLELEYEIQSKITSAALKIANDSHAAKSVRKQRKVSYQQSQRKLKDIEAKLNALKHSRQLKRRGGGGSGTRTSPDTVRRGISVPDLDLTLDDEVSGAAIAPGGASGGAMPKLSLLTQDTVDAAKSCPASPRKPGQQQALHPHHQQAPHKHSAAITSAKIHSKPDSVSLEASPQR